MVVGGVAGGARAVVGVAGEAVEGAGLAGGDEGVVEAARGADALV